MSSATEALAADNLSKKSNWALWARQMRVILRLEVKKNFLGKRSILIYLLAMAPLPLLAAISIFAIPSTGDPSGNVGKMIGLFASLYDGLILRTVVFFGCAWIFMNLFRGELVYRSLHYYFLSPVRREVLVAGKYISGLIASSVLFTVTTVASLFFIYMTLDYPANTKYLMEGPGLGQAFSYIGITLLACFGYGAFFLVIGLFFRNPIVPAVTIYLWEGINLLLPPVLKKISVIYYLHSLSPVPLSQGSIAIVADPLPPWLAIGGLMVVSAAVLVLAGYRIRSLEVKYLGE
jgi:ABC-type transport system involved in multi-copper enzyme maturation permease subunit